MQGIIKLLRATGLMPIANRIINAKHYLLTYISKRTGKNHLSILYNETFFENENQERILGNTPQLLARLVIEVFHPRSVVDIGCGTGIYLKKLSDFSLEVFGIDGSPASAKHSFIKPEQLLIYDITKPLYLEKRYDCALCIEVAEHIPTSGSAALIDNLTRASHIIIFSAAPKGQGGIGHINEQNPVFWERLFLERHYSNNTVATNRFRSFLKENGSIFWLQNNVTIYVRNR